MEEEEGSIQVGILRLKEAGEELRQRLKMSEKIYSQNTYVPVREESDCGYKPTIRGSGPDKEAGFTFTTGRGSKFSGDMQSIDSQRKIIH